MSADTPTDVDLLEAARNGDVGIKPSAAVNRYARALKPLKGVFEGMPGGIEGVW